MRFLARTTTLLNKIFDDLLPGNDADKMPCSWSHSPQWDELLHTHRFNLYGDPSIRPTHYDILMQPHQACGCSHRLANFQPRHLQGYTTQTSCVLDEFPHIGSYTHVTNEIMCVFQKYMDDRRIIYEQELLNMRTRISITAERRRSSAIELHRGCIHKGYMDDEIDIITADICNMIDGASRGACVLMDDYESRLRLEYTSHSEGYCFLMQYVLGQVCTWYRECLMTSSPSCN